MPLPIAAADRRLQHRRSLVVEVYSRPGGLWEVDALLTDVKTRDVQMEVGLRRAGEPIHQMLLRLVVDEHFDVVAAGSETRWMPYPGQCDDHADSYGRLVGLNLLRGFRHGLRERVGGVLGCTHITELAQVIPTAVVQAFAGLVIDTRGSQEGAERPFQIDRCHALRSEGDVVRQHYPRWHLRPGPAPEAPTEAASPRTPE